jgi:hypothetical protein
MDRQRIRQTVIIVMLYTELPHGSEARERESSLRCAASHGKYHHHKKERGKGIRLSKHGK